ncbi:uncharacterized protein [Prorops nasuta]|uniref:uncharacterized protein n=1 Tax=Prorops nasuta TaxID=863751 RepID=UPI0034CF4234
MEFIELVCTMCYYKCISYSNLMNHILRYHRFDPLFKIQCVHHGCGSTFKKWKSFRQHLFRKHPNYARLNNDIISHQEDHNDFLYAIDDNSCDRCNEDSDEGELVCEEILDVTKLIECNVAQFIVNIRENCNVSNAAVEKIIDGVTSLVDFYLAVIMKEIRSRSDPDTNEVNFQDIKVICTEKYPAKFIFSSIQSKKALDKILVNTFNMVPTKTVVIGTGLRWKKIKQSLKSSSEIKEVEYKGYIVPFINNLRNLLNNKEVRCNIKSYKNYNDGVLRSVLDGQFYQENDFFRRNKNALAIILYYDDVGVTNPIGAASKVHKLSMFYWTLANIKPEVRSSLNIIQLYAIVKTDYLKKANGLEKILESFISDIIQLQTAGIDINVGGKIKNFKGSLLFCAGDTPASAMLGGFKQSVQAYRPCRTCMVTNLEWRKELCKTYISRTKETHQEYLRIVTDSSITKEAKEVWQKQYGINKRSPLMQIPYFDVAMCFPQDAMHILIEGVLETTFRAFLRYCIMELKLFTIDDLNERLRNFDFKHFKSDKPALLLSCQLAKDSHLRQSAAQIPVLYHTLPFLIGEWIIANDNIVLEDHIHCYILLLQIINICLAYEINKDSIELLNQMIDTFLLIFNRLYPDSVVHKFHFLKHIPYYINLFGPARQQWCFRFDATHAYFKSIVPVVRNFKNIALTLCYRHQAKLSSRLSSCPGMPSKKFLYQGDYVASGHSILICNLPYSNIFHGIVKENEWFSCEMMRSSKIIIY